MPRFHRSPSVPAAILACALTVAGASAASGEARRTRFFDRLDVDSSGAVSQAEFDRARESSFAAIDSDADGALAPGEFVERPVRTGSVPPARKESIRLLRTHRFGDLDRDGDGRVTRAEYLAFGRALFRAIDRNGDGVMTKAEQGRFRPGRAGPEPGPAPDRVFAALDRDGDGAVTAAEIAATRAAAFDWADLNEDGVITRDEFRMKGGGQAGALPPELERRLMRGRPDPRFAEIDRDGDGRLSRPEFVDAARPRFAAADRDGNGRLTPEEFRAYRPGG